MVNCAFETEANASNICMYSFADESASAISRSRLPCVRIYCCALELCKQINLDITRERSAVLTYMAKVVIAMERFIGDFPAATVNYYEMFCQQYSPE